MTTFAYTSIKMHFYLAAAHSKIEGKGILGLERASVFESWSKGEAAYSGLWNSGDSGMQISRVVPFIAHNFSSHSWEQPLLHQTSSAGPAGLSTVWVTLQTVVWSWGCSFFLRRDLTIPVSILHAAGKASGEQKPGEWRVYLAARGNISVCPFT